MSRTADIEKGVVEMETASSLSCKLPAEEQMRLVLIRVSVITLVYVKAQPVKPRCALVEHEQDEYIENKVLTDP